MERRVLLAISLSFLVLFGYQTFLAPKPPPDAAGGTAPPAAAATAPAPAATGAQGGVAPQAPVVTGPTDTLVGETEVRSITVETTHVRAVFSNRGARLEHWQLKDYHDSAGQPVDLVPVAVAATPGTPFSLRSDDAQVTADLNQAVYRVTGAAGNTVDATSAPATLTFEMETGSGLRARKVFTLAPESYVIGFSANVERQGQPIVTTIDWGAGLGDQIAQMPSGSFFSANSTHPAQAIFQKDGSVTRIVNTSLGTGKIEEGQMGFAGIDDLYFVAVAIKPPAPSLLHYTPLSLPDPANPSQIGKYVSWSIRTPGPVQDLKFYFGPKQLDALRAVDPELTRVIHFGIFAWLAAPLLGALKWVHGFVGNYGWSIVVLTILINLAMWPLRHKSVVSMRRMQELQPQMKVIQDRYAKYKITDPERGKMNTEVMALYKEKGVSPASGCVPMLLTMPFLFAFYAMLSQSIEIRGASFLGWIHDLSMPDPLYVTPLLMGITMFWQQRLTPSSADPTQQKVMMVMPFMFTFMSFNFPSGLVIYWLVSNTWAIGQQYFTNYLIGTPQAHNVRAGEKRPKA